MKYTLLVPFDAGMTMHEVEQARVRLSVEMPDNVKVIAVSGMRGSATVIEVK